MKKAVIINPTYNEKENIVKLIEQLETEIFPKIKNWEMAILVADDYSPDGTADEVKKLMGKWKNIEISQGKKEGLGAAYVRGMDYAFNNMNADVVFEMDADGQHDSTRVPLFLDKLDAGYDMVIGNRYSDGGSIPKNWPMQRKIFSVSANIFVRSVFMTFSIHDWTGGYRAITKAVFEKEKPYLSNFRGYIFQISFLHIAIRDGFKVAEVPFHFSDRTLGKSKIAPMDYIIDVVSFVLTTRFKELQRIFKFLVVGGTGFIVQIIFQEGSFRLGIALAIATFFVSFGAIKDVVASSNFLAAAFGAEAAIISNFLFNNFWTFSDTKHIKEQSPFITRAIKFNIASLLSIFLQAAAVFIGVKFFGSNIVIFTLQVPTRIVVLFPTIIFIIIPLNYLIYNVLIWKTQYLKHAQNKTA